MKIILSVESLFKKSGGIGSYTLHLLDGLRKNQNIEQVLCYSVNKWVDYTSIKSYQNELHKNKRSLNGIKDKIKSLPFVYDSFAKYKDISFYLRTKNKIDAIYHEPNFILKPFNGKSITTIHDLSFVHYPDFHPDERVRYFCRKLDKTIRSTSHIITDSAFIEKELIEYGGLNESDITSVPLGVSPDYCPRSGKELMRVLQHYKLQSGKYLLSVSTLEPRKNIMNLLEAYTRLDALLKKNYPLVIVGQEGWLSSELKEKISYHVRKGEVIRIGYVSSADLLFIFAGARGFVFIPYYEGFGLPPLEAMASGVPVLVSDRASIPEVVGDSGLMVEPDDVDDISIKLEKLLTDTEWRNKAAQIGHRRARGFDWGKCVDKTVDVYKEVSSS